MVKSYRKKRQKGGTINRLSEPPQIIPVGRRFDQYDFSQQDDPKKEYLNYLVQNDELIRNTTRAQFNKKSSPKKRKANGFINDLINKLPFELHAPGGYNYLGPGTNYADRISGRLGIAKQIPINDLDHCAMIHDGAYENNNTVEGRKQSDIDLRNCAKQVYRNKNKKWKERALAYTTDKIFQLKGFLGAGINTIHYN